MKEIITVIVAVSALLIGCTNSPKNSKQNIELIEKYIQSVENLDYETMEAILDDNYIGYGPSINDSITKNLAVQNWKRTVEFLYKSVKYDRSRNAVVLVDSGINEGEWVSNWAQATIVYKGSENSVTIWANTIYQIKNNKIIKSYSFYNEADVYEQLGFANLN
jgi:hypothetical protein